MKEPDFDLSADMRLLELQRNSLGLTAPERGSWESRYSSDSTPGAGDAASVSNPQALIVATLAANPSEGVIAGAVITLSLAIANEGTAPAKGVVAAVSMPAGAAYRNGSYVRDGRAGTEDDAEAFLNEGVSVGTLPPGARATFVWKAGVKLGSGALVFAPQVRAERVPVAGASALRVDRKHSAATAFAAEVDRIDAALYDPKPLIPVDLPASELPIYELDPEEELEYEAAEAALSPAAETPVREPAVQAEAAPEPEPETAVETMSEASIETRSEASPEAEPQVVPVREAIELYAAFDRATLVFFERTFQGGKAPTMLHHCIFGGSLACSLDARGNDAFGLRAHLAAQSQILHRISLHEKLGRKEPIAEYAGELLADVSQLAPEPVVREHAPLKDAVLLQCEIHEPARGVLERLTAERARWDFVKSRQLALALQATAVVHPDEAVRAQAANALRQYAQASMTMLQKLFVRLRLDRSTAVLSQPDPQTDAAARLLLAALAKAI